jgi:hypothetical protein
MTTNLAPKLDGIERAGLFVALRACEAKIERGLTAFCEVGAALFEIRENRLYRVEFASFEAYCQERWGFSRQRAHQLIHGAETAAKVSTVVDAAPTNEAQSRELAKVPEADQAEVWSAVVDEAGGVENVTAAKVREAVQRRAEPEPADDSGGLGLEPGDAELGPDEDPEPVKPPERDSRKEFVSRLIAIEAEFSHIPQPVLLDWLQDFVDQRRNP